MSTSGLIAVPTARRARRDAIPALAVAWAVAFVAGPVSATSGVGTGTPMRAGAVPHEVPADVAVQAYVRPEEGRLTVLVRVPLESMRDVEFPLRPGGTLALEDPRLEGLLREAATLWIAGYLRFWEDGEPLPDESVAAVRLSIPSDRSFRSFEGARSRTDGAPLPARVQLRPEVALLDVRLEVPISDPRSRFAVDPELAHLGVSTVSVIHLVLPDGAERVFRYEGNPGRLELDPRWLYAVSRFTGLGFRHILGGLDHLLFLLCLVAPLRSVRRLVPVVTAFTIAHSITLVAAALGLTPSALWFPPFVETLIAASIVWMALENVVQADLSRRWALAFGFGLVHGFGFSFALGETMQFAGGHLLSSLLAFNVGVELGQLLVLVIAVPALSWAFRRVGVRVGEIVLSVLVAHTAWHWMTARGAEFLAYDVGLFPFEPARVPPVLAWVGIVGTILVAAVFTRRATAANRRPYFRTVRGPTSAP